MSTIAGVRIHPGFFNRKRAVAENHVGISPVRLKKTTTVKPHEPKAKYAMPVVAIVAAFVAVEAAVAVTTIFSVITAIGAVTAAVGAVTGNQKLMKIGGIISIVGGIGSFASSSGMFGGADAAMDASGTITPEGVSPGASGYTNDAISAAAPSTSSAVEDVGMIGGANPPTVGGVPTPTDLAGNVATDAAGVGGVTPAPVTTPPVVDTGLPLPGQSNGLVPEPGGAVTPGASSGQTIDVSTTNRGTFDSMMKGFDKVGEFTKPMTDWAKSNPVLTSQLLQGISSAADPSQRAQREASTTLANQQSATIEQQRKNMSGVGGIIDWTKIFKQPVAAAPTTGSGMISRAGGG